MPDQQDLLHQYRPSGLADLEVPFTRPLTGLLYALEVQSFPEVQSAPESQQALEVHLVPKALHYPEAHGHQHKCLTSRTFFTLRPTFTIWPLRAYFTPSTRRP